MSSAAPSERRLQLAPHVRACRVDEQVILLDLAQDKYVGIGGTQLAGMSRAILDWPCDSSLAGPELDVSASEPIVTKLLQQRMLTSPDRFRGAAPSLDPASHSFQFQPDKIAWRRQWPALVNLCLSAWTASRWLKRYNLGEIAKGVQRLRRRCRSSQASNMEALQLAVSSYLQLRPFVFTSQDRCLHDSLSLILFLARRRLYPTWVIGVRTRPFCAHSWVQSGDTVLNDLHENVRAFTPILIV